MKFSLGQLTGRQKKYLEPKISTPETTSRAHTPVHKRPSKEMSIRIVIFSYQNSLKKKIQPYRCWSSSLRCYANGAL
jgi:hypothetical protein